jgi:hypothetical protein
MKNIAEHVFISMKSPQKAHLVRHVRAIFEKSKSEIFAGMPDGIFSKVLDYHPHLILAL